MPPLFVSTRMGTCPEANIFICTKRSSLDRSPCIDACAIPSALSCSCTNEQLASGQLVPNHSLRKAMEQRRDEQPMAIDPARLAVSDELLGEGSHGRVIAGTLTTGRRTLRVAVKTLPAMTREQERQAFSTEDTVRPLMVYWRI